MLFCCDCYVIFFSGKCCRRTYISHWFSSVQNGSFKVHPAEDIRSAICAFLFWHNFFCCINAQWLFTTHTEWIVLGCIQLFSSIFSPNYYFQHNSLIIHANWILVISFFLFSIFVSFIGLSNQHGWSWLIIKPVYDVTFYFFFKIIVIHFSTLFISTKHSIHMPCLLMHGCEIIDIGVEVFTL